MRNLHIISISEEWRASKLSKYSLIGKIWNYINLSHKKHLTFRVRERVCMCVCACATTLFLSGLLMRWRLKLQLVIATATAVTKDCIYKIANIHLQICIYKNIYKVFYLKILTKYFKVLPTQKKLIGRICVIYRKWKDFHSCFIMQLPWKLSFYYNLVQ